MQQNKNALHIKL